MSKKLNIIEAMKMPIGTSFKVFHKIQGENCQTMIIADSHGEKVFKWSEDDMAMIREYTIDATFIPIQQPVSFMEAITSGKKVIAKCKGYGNIDEIYLPVSNILKIIINSNELYGKEIVEKAVNNFIVNGKWYIEESEELEDERLS